MTPVQLHPRETELRKARQLRRSIQETYQRHLWKVKTHSSFYFRTTWSVLTSLNRPEPMDSDLKHQELCISLVLYVLTFQSPLVS